MTKQKETYKTGMLWQDETKDKKIEDILKDAVDYFVKKFYALPEIVYINSEVDLKTYGNVPLKKDKQMYSRGLLLMILPQ